MRRISLVSKKPSSNSIVNSIIKNSKSITRPILCATSVNFLWEFLVLPVEMKGDGGWGGIRVISTVGSSNRPFKE